MTSLSSFTLGYIECALWSSVDEYGEPLDAVHSIDDIHPDTLRLIECDCQAFEETYADWLSICNEKGRDHNHLGHDFWLSRNGHGTGFWDRGLGEVGDKLHNHAQVFGSCDLYVGDDGMIHI